MSDDTPKLAALVIACLASFTTPFMGSSINLALPTISKEFDMNAITLGWVATSYLLASAMFLLPFGRAGDIYGRKKIFSYGIAIYTLGSLLSALSTSATMLIISRVIQGFGGSMIFGTSVAILTSVYPPEERGKVLGINVAFVYLGLSLGPFLGGFLTQQLGWRSIFYLNLPIGVIILVLVFWKLKGEWAEARGEKLDIPGSLIYGASLVLLILGLTRLPSLPGVWLALAGLAGLIIFFRWESRAESPVFNVRVFRTNLVFALSNAAALIHYSATFAVTFLLSLFLQYNKGLSPLAAGLILISQPIMMTAFSPLAGRLSDRIEPRMVSSLGMAITCVSIFLLAFINPGIPLAYIVSVLLFAGLGYALFSSPNTNAVMSSVEPRFLGVAAATLGTMRTVGMMFSMATTMMIFSIYMGQVKITPDLYDTFLNSARILFIIFGVLCVFGIFSSMARGKIHSE